MKRLVWLLLAAFGTALLPVLPVQGATMPAEPMSCCGPGSACDHQSSAPCDSRPARECPACLPCAVSCCFAVLPAADSFVAAPASIARLESAAEKGAQRRDPPPLTPPRGLA